MRVEAFLDALRDMPLISPADLTRGKPFIVLSPHPDDESLGVGGLIAAACEARQRVDIVILTDGSGSHPHSRRFPPERLISLREQEAARAVDALGLPAGHLTHLRLPDTKAPTMGSTFDNAVDRLDHLVEACAAECLFVTWGHDPHCDHEAADLMARALRARKPDLALWSYPIWDGTCRGTPRSMRHRRPAIASTFRPGLTRNVPPLRPMCRR